MALVYSAIALWYSFLSAAAKPGVSVDAAREFTAV